MPSALEGALKLKENSLYPVVSLCCRGTETRHFGLDRGGCADFGSATQSDVYDKMVINIQEVNSSRRFTLSC